MGSDAGIVRLMHDIGDSLRENPGMIMLGGGNPSRIPAMEAEFRARMDSLLQRPGGFEDAIVGQPAGRI